MISKTKEILDKNTVNASFCIQVKLT